MILPRCVVYIVIQHQLFVIVVYGIASLLLISSVWYAFFCIPHSKGEVPFQSVSAINHHKHFPIASPPPTHTHILTHSHTESDTFCVLHCKYTVPPLTTHIQFTGSSKTTLTYYVLSLSNVRFPPNGFPTTT